METTRYVLKWQHVGPLYQRPVDHERELEAKTDLDAQQEAAKFLSRELVGGTVRANVRLEKSTTYTDTQTLPVDGGKPDWRQIAHDLAWSQNGQPHTPYEQEALDRFDAAVAMEAS